MKSKMLTIVALMLCVSALFLPVTTYAATDTTPPSVNAWLQGDTLHIEASDRGSGVEAVYIDGHRIGYLVDGAVEVGLSGYAGDGEFIIVHALDYTGNKSSEVKLDNPRYTAPTTTPAPSGTIPAPNPTPAPASSQPASSTPRPSASSQPSTSTPAPSSTPEPAASDEPNSGSESAIPDEVDSNPFTPDGTGSVLDNATDGDGKEFFTITTEDGNVFYLIIDRQRDSEGVYLLNAVTEDDLMALAEGGGSGSGVSAIPDPDPTPQPTPDPEPTPEPEPEPAAESNTGTIIFVIIAVLAAGGAGYYFKILRPKQLAALNPDDEDEPDEYDDLDDEDEYDFSDDYADDEESDREEGGGDEA